MSNNGHVTIGIDGDASGFERELNSIGSKTKAGLADIKAGFDMVSAAAKGLFSVAADGVKYTANIEQLQTSFEVMTGSAEKAAEVVNRLRTMGAETPFEMADLAGTTQLLMQYGFTADDALEKMRMLGDIAQGNAESMNSIAMGYAQMSSAGKVNLQDIKQMINGGFNPLQEISERTGESMASLYDRISNGSLQISEITESMKYATSEGGKFFQSMEKQSQTLNGQLSTLKDNADQLLGSLTQGISEELRVDLLPLANNMISSLQEAFDASGFDGLMDAAADMMPDLVNLMTGKLEDALSTLSKFAPKAVTSLMKAVPNAVRSTSTILPQVTSALFDMGASIIRELVGMLPELVPELVLGFGNMLNESITGIGQLLNGFYDGLEQAAHKGQKKFAGVWIDQTNAAKYDFSMDVEVDTETPANEVKEGLDSIIENISNALTDGLPDTEEVMSGLEGEVRTWAQDAYTKINEWYDSEIQELNASGATGAEYEARRVEIETEAENLRGGVQEAEVAAILFLNSMAGKSTEYVQQHLDDLRKILEEAESSVTRIDELSNEARNAAANAFEVVRSGANADEATIGMAIKFKFEEFKLDTQSAEDEYNAAVADLNAKLAAGDIGKDSYDLQIGEKAQKLETAKAAAKAAYENALAEIMSGVAEASGESAAFDAASNNSKMLARQLLISMFNEMQTTGWADLGADAKQGIADAISVILGETMTVEQLEDSGQAGALIDQMIAQSAESVDTEFLSGKVGEVLSAAYAQGMLKGTSFDTTDAEAQMEAVLVSIASLSIDGAKPQVEQISEGLGETVASGLDNYDGAYSSGVNSVDGLADGIQSQRARLLSIVSALANDVVATYNQKMQIQSPSRVMKQAGIYTGQGLEIGLRESMERAASIARQITGQILPHSVSIKSISNVSVSNMPNLQHEIIAAREKAPTILEVNGRELARAVASDTHRTQNDYNRSISLGYGK